MHWGLPAEPPTPVRRGSTWTCYGTTAAGRLLGPVHAWPMLARLSDTFQRAGEPEVIRDRRVPGGEQCGGGGRRRAERGPGGSRLGGEADSRAGPCCEQGGDRPVWAGAGVHGHLA